MTEAERIEKDAEQWCNNYDRGGYEITPTDCYIAGATAENSRLQQLIKEKDEQLDYLHLKLGFSENTNKKFSEAYNEKEKELKSAQDLLRDINDSWNQLNELTPELEERIKSILK